MREHRPEYAGILAGTEIMLGPGDLSASDQEYVRLVRRYDPSSLIPLISQTAARFVDPDDWLGDRKHFAPWILADIARVSLTESRPSSRRSADLADLVQCSRYYMAQVDPELSANPDEGFSGFMLRMGFEQLSFQHSVLNDLSRTAALFCQTKPAGRHASAVFVDGWDRDLLGCSITEYVGAGLLLMVGAHKNGGIFRADWFAQETFEEVVREVPAPILNHVVDDLFSATPAWYRASQKQVYRHASPFDPGHRKFLFNPLVNRPVVRGLDSHDLIPCPPFLVRKVSPLGLFYLGVDRWGSRFSDELGPVFEAYVGRNLELLQDAELFPEIEYARNQYGVDWIVVTDECVLLVDAKSTRPTEAIRRGSEQGHAALQVKLAKGVRQLGHSARMIDEGHPAFRHIPASLPKVGLIVTLEPFYTAHANLVAPFDDPGLPFSICGAQDLENLVAVSDDPPLRVLLNWINRPEQRSWSVKQAIVGHDHERNSVIDAGWNSYPWVRGATAV